MSHPIYQDRQTPSAQYSQWLMGVAENALCVTWRLNHLIKNVSLIQCKDFVPIYPNLIIVEETKLFELVTGTEMKPWLSRNILPNINTCENGRSNFSANLRVVSLNLLELTQFAWPNLSIYFNFSCAVPRDDVIESTRFLMRPPVNHPPWYILWSMKEVHLFSKWAVVFDKFYCNYFFFA